MWTNRGTGKYGAQKTTVRGVAYHSKLEAEDARWLQDLEKKGDISQLKEQVRYRIYVAGTEVGSSVVDFQFVYKGTLVWYETKGFPTALYKFKRKCIEAQISQTPGELYIVNAADMLQVMSGTPSHV